MCTSEIFRCLYIGQFLFFPDQLFRSLIAFRPLDMARSWFRFDACLSSVWTQQNRISNYFSAGARRRRWGSLGLRRTLRCVYRRERIRSCCEPEGQARMLCFRVLRSNLEQRHDCIASTYFRFEMVDPTEFHPREFDSLPPLISGALKSCSLNSEVAGPNLWLISRLLHACALFDQTINTRKNA